MDGPALFEHRHELLDAAGSRLRTLGVVDAEQDRVAVGAVKRLERAAGPGVAAQRAGEVVGDLDRAGAGVGRVPPPVGLRRIDLRLPGWSHPTCRDQRLGAVAVDLRPLAARLPRREALPEVRLVV